MQNEVIAKIDILLSMCETSSDLSTLQIQLDELEKTLAEKESKLKLLKASINDEKYYDESSEIVDKNIEISLNKKIKSLKKSYLEIEKQIEEELEKEDSCNKELENLQASINEKEEFLHVLNEKKKMLDSSVNFDKLIKDTEEKLKKDNKEFKSKKKTYDKIQGKLEVLSFSKSEFEKKIDDESSKLIDVKANLLNKRNYVNNELKEEDEKNLSELENDIGILKKEKNEILDNPIFIAQQAKSYLFDEDYTSALKEIEVLKEIVLSQPYMDLDGNNAKETLEIELENAKAKRDEFSSMINSKNYESVDTTLIKDRLAYITDKKQNLLDEIENIKEKIKSIDTVELDDLCNRINYCENEAENLKNKISEFKENSENEDFQINKKVSLQASLLKKEEELNNILKLLESYKNDRNSLIMKSYDLEVNQIKSLESEIEVLEKEYKKLNQLIISTDKVKDTIAIENDKNYLKELNNNIKAIKKRQSFDESPNEIYKDIEIILGKNIDLESQVKKTDLNESLESDEYSYELDSSKFDEKLDDIEQLDILSDDNIVEDNTLIEDEQTEEELNLTDINNEEETLDNMDSEETLGDSFIEPIDEPLSIDSLNVIDDEDLALNVMDINNVEENKIKVINIEPLDNNSNEDDNSEFLIGDYNS